MNARAIMLLAGLSALTAPSYAAWEDVFSRLDLQRPGLEAVRAAAEAGDTATAAAALKTYFRERREPFYITDRFSRPEPKADYNREGADKVLRREFTFVGKPYTLTHRIDWNADPFQDVEWPIELNRHGIWVTLARAYWNTHDEQYAEDLVYQLNDWLAENPRPDSPRQSRWTWRTLECGIRMSGSWPEVLFRVIDSEHFTPELLCLMLEGIWQQCDFLMDHHGGGNWLVCEKSALVTAGIVFPEFADAETWLSSGWDVLSRELESQVYPDGAQVELTPHYHSATLGSFRQAYDIADRNGAEIPPAYRGHMERMYEYLMYVVKPDGFVPMFNDSDHGNMRGWMRDGAQRFGRQDMLYIATGGQEGTPPAGPSHAFPWAGQYVMRSGWTMDDVYLAMDAGPYGLGHQHEDKLTVDVWAYGQEMILDPGRYTYAGGKWRSYFVSTQSHPTLLVNGQGQQRRRTPRATWVPGEPRLNRWVSTEAFDFAVGSYEDGYDSIEDLIHVRKVLFVKPDYFVITDLLLPYTETDREVEATVQWQLARPGAQLDPQTLAVHSVGPEANVLIIPAEPESLTVSMHEGEEDPPAGWIGWSLHQALKEPATLVRYTRKGVPPLRFDTIIRPYRGEEPPSAAFDEYPVPEAARPYVDAEPAAGPDAVDLDTPDVTIRVGETTVMRLRYGYAAGGGFLFETPPMEPVTSATLSIQDPRYELPYVYEALAHQRDGWRVVQHGTIRIPEPRAFDFEDGTLQAWEGPSARLVEGCEGTKGALRVDAEAAADARYITVSRAQKLTTSERTRFTFACRTPVAEGGDWFYAKVTLRDEEGVDWSAYFAREPFSDWRQVDVSLADFRGDVQDHPQQGKPMPAGLRIGRVSLTLRKGQTADPIQPALEIDDFRIED